MKSSYSSRKLEVVLGLPSQVLLDGQCWGVWRQQTQSSPGGCVVALVRLWSQMTWLWTHFPLPATWLQQTLLVLISDPAHLPVPLNIKWWRAANSLHLWPTVECYSWLTRLWDHYHSWYHCHSLPSPQWVRLRLSLSPHPVHDRLSWRVVGTCSWISVLASASRKPNSGG